MRKQALHPITARINKKQKATSKSARHRALQWLAQRFPQAFNSDECIRPLKLGIMQDILNYAEEASDAGISKSKLREAVVIFTRRIDYLACLKAQEVRVDLMGHPTSQVSSEEAEKAAAKIKKRIEKTIKNTHKTTSPSLKTLSSSTTTTKLTPHHYPEPPVLQQITSKRPTPSITVKPTRTYDPQAIARLKEKLGLSSSKQELTSES
jgi:ProP effector